MVISTSYPVALFVETKRCWFKAGEASAESGILPLGDKCHEVKGDGTKDA